jgi:tetratricopeptide (TPR) repeat protein
MRCAQRTALVWLVGLCLAPRLVLADAAQARAHFERGRTYFEVDEYRKAIAEFKAAHIEKPDPAFLYNIAECHRRLGEVAEALQFYRRFLATAPAGDKTRPVVEQRITDLQSVADVPKPGPGDAPAESGATADSLPLSAPPPAAEPDAAATLIEKPAPAPAVRSGAFYTRPWFLITVGAVVVASTLGIWALSRSPEPPETVLGNRSIF